MDTVIRKKWNDMSHQSYTYILISCITTIGSNPSNILCWGVLPGNRILVIVSDGSFGCQITKAQIEFKFIKVLRLFRILRPLRIVAKIEGLMLI